MAGFTSSSLRTRASRRRPVAARRLALATACAITASAVLAPTVDAASAPPPPAPATTILVQPTDLGSISPYLFGSNLLWPYNAEGAFNPVSRQFYPPFLGAALSTGL